MGLKFTKSISLRNLHSETSPKKFYLSCFCTNIFLSSSRTKKKILSHVVSKHFVFGRDLTEEWQTAARYKISDKQSIEKIFLLLLVPNTQFLLLYSQSDAVPHAHFIHFGYTPIRRGWVIVCLSETLISFSGIFSFLNLPLCPCTLHPFTIRSHLL